MTLRTVAPAKINLTLEILGRRADGYHEIRSVMQTIDIVDTLTLQPADELSLHVEGSHKPPDNDLALQAARAMAVASDIPASGSFRLEKHIPEAAGLGGGSADAAAAIRLLNRQHKLGLTPQTMASTAASISSDAAFFCFGGTASVGGRGEVVESLPDAKPFWIVVLTPSASIPRKTKRMYDSLESGDFTHGDATGRLAEHIRRHGVIESGDLYNAFDRAAYETFDGLRENRDALLKAGAGTVHVAGSGPALFTLAKTESNARAIANHLGETRCQVDVARSTSADDAVAVQE